MEGIKDATVALIDADSLIFIIGSNHQDSNDEESVVNACQSLLNMIMQATEATHYIGSFSGKDCFRDEVYNVRKYKGTRGPKADWYYRWRPLIVETYKKQHKFVEMHRLEADDVVIAAHHFVREAGGIPVICSNDKDLRQVPGKFYDYKKIEFEELNEEEARRNLLVQYLAGDSTDNVVGVPKIGPSKAKIILDKEEGEELGEELAIYRAYEDYYGPHYGSIIHAENKQVIQMVQPGHPQWDRFKSDLEKLVQIGLVDIRSYNFED